MIRRMITQHSYWMILFGWSAVQLVVALMLVQDQEVDALVVFDQIIFSQARLSKPFWYGVFFFPLLVHVMYVSPSLGTMYTEVLRFRSFRAWIVNRLIFTVISYCLFYRHWGNPPILERTRLS
ncbi:hypothetical protein D7Z54_04045 [Salibacterium salarium]|uniref:Uncharacterized protein n=1 Tax=Salibacterium salarium TaxID=284579 RepID=A0A3R9Q603_9BACI|nr:hypothetical protein [Salibacterium salarium]RSL34342.1 hypothetical protein D7Z54_04045 [Salibacterium salarium]